MLIHYTRGYTRAGEVVETQYKGLHKGGEGFDTLYKSIQWIFDTLYNGLYKGGGGC